MIIDNNNASQRYKKRIAERNQENLNTVRFHASLLSRYLTNNVPKLTRTETTHAKTLLEKITNREEKWGTLYGESAIEVCTNIIANDWVAAAFSKDPSRQNTSEEIQLVILKENNIKVEQLPNKGPTQITFLYGREVYGSIPDSEKEYGANCDYKFKTSKGLVYATGKLTHGIGGLQSYQVNCVEHWIKNAIEFIDNNPDSTHRFAAIIDGDTFQNPIVRKNLDTLIINHQDWFFIGTVKELVEGSFLN